MHKRLFPKVNAFTYGIYYLCLPLSGISEYADGWRFGVDRPAIVGFHAKDHATRTPQDGFARLGTRSLVRRWYRLAATDNRLDGDAAYSGLRFQSGQLLVLL